MVQITSGLYERIYQLTTRIPSGQVATYGQLAELAGIPGAARQIGYALAALGRGRPRPEVPWHRVVNADGKSSIGGDQITRLQAEGVPFGENGRIDLTMFGWDGVEQA